MVEDIDKGSKGSDGLENEYDGIQNLELRARILLETIVLYTRMTR